MTNRTIEWALSVKAENEDAIWRCNHFLAKKPSFSQLIIKAQCEKEVAMANVVIYLNDPAAIGGQDDILEAIEEQIEKIAEAKGKIKALKAVENKFGMQYELQ